MDEKKLVREGYDKIASEYQTRRNEELEEFTFLPEFASMIPQGEKVLDAGCGGGLPFTRYLSESFDVIGIDISDEMIKLAIKNVPDAEFFRIDMTKLGFPNNYFSGILAYYSIIHVPREEQHRLFTNFIRMLKPNGVALFTLHSTDDPASVFDDFFGETMFWSGFDEATNLKILTEIGFEIIWSKLIGDSLGDSKHLVVLIRKPA
ncbi:MAG: class I SAM-dependent methyltransferase [Candidatus Heimdallarchaeota archaeon]